MDNVRTDGTERPTLDDTFFAVAGIFAERSTCPDGARHGCVITIDDRVVATGYGSPAIGFPPCKKCWLREEFARTGVKNWSVCPAIHAEVNAVACAARNGVSILYATAWVTREPCERCYAVFHSAGIAEVCWPEALTGEKRATHYIRRVLQIPVSESW
jgi:dCMP deaminase